jgi:hypothetical protein
LLRFLGVFSGRDVWAWRLCLGRGEEGGVRRGGGEGGGKGREKERRREGEGKERTTFSSPRPPSREGDRRIVLWHISFDEFCFFGFKLRFHVVGGKSPGN